MWSVDDFRSELITQHIQVFTFNVLLVDAYESEMLGFKKSLTNENDLIETKDV